MENQVLFAKSGIHIKKKNRGKFTDYCGGKVTSECIARGKASSNPAIRKRATFAANARKWKHENGGTIEKHQAGKVIGLGKRFVSPITKKFSDYGTLAKSLRLQKSAYLLEDPAAYAKFWWGKRYSDGDVFGASYFRATDPTLVKRMGRTVFNIEGPRAVYTRKYPTLSDARSAFNDDIHSSTQEYLSEPFKTTEDIIKDISRQAAGLKSGNVVSLTEPEALSVDSWPLYMKLLQRRAAQGKGWMEPVIDDGTYRMVKLNDYGRGGTKSLQRIDKIIKDFQLTDPKVPGRIGVGSTQFVPIWRYTEFKKGGKL